MNNIQEVLNKALELDGAVGVAIADYESGMCLGVAGVNPSFDLEIAAAGNSEVIRAKLKIMEALGLDDQIQDILTTLGKEYHLLFPRPGSTLFIYVCLSRQKSNLALARHKVAELLASLTI